MPGISLIANFDVNAPFPIDSRLVVSDLTARNAIVWKYEGLKVYVLSEKQSYIWQDSTWRVEYNGIYGGSGSLPGNVTVDFGTFSNNVGSQSYYFEYESGFDNKQSFLQNQFIRHTTSLAFNDEWRGVEFRQQLKYYDGSIPALKKESAYISFNPSLSGTNNQNPGGMAFGTGYLFGNIPITERLRITSNGQVGIGTNDPKAILQIGSSSTTETPLVLDNRTNVSSIAYNWYFTTVDNYFDPNKSSARISFASNGITFLNRSQGIINTLTSSLFLSSSLQTLAYVGIRTTDPRGHLQIGLSSSTTRPIIIHNEDFSAGIGYNWFYNAQDNVFDLTKSSINMAFEQNGLNIRTRRSNLAINSFTSSLFVNVRNRVGVNNTNPQFTLDVNGVINGSSDVLAGRNIKAADKVETTNGYFFKNSTVSSITSVNNSISFIADTGDNLKMLPNSNIFYKTTRVVGSNLVIASGLSPDNSRHTQGLVFEAAYSAQGSGIYHYQGLQSNSDMGISILSKFNNQDRESLRISEGGKRIQMGVPSNINSVHIFTDILGNNNYNQLNNLQGTFTYSKSAIDTKNDMHVNYNALSRPNINFLYNLIQSGRYEYNDVFMVQTVTQNWTRVGRIINVNLKITRLDPSQSFILALPLQNSPVSLPIEINTLSEVEVTGICHGYIEPYTDPITGPEGGYATSFRISLSGFMSGALGYLEFTTLSSMSAPNTQWKFKQIFGSYTIFIR